MSRLRTIGVRFVFQKIDWVMPCPTKDLMAFWERVIMRRALMKKWVLAPHCITRGTLKELKIRLVLASFVGGTFPVGRFF